MAMNIIKSEYTSLMGMVGLTILATKNEYLMNFGENN